MARSRDVLSAAMVQAKSTDPKKMAEVMHSGKAFKTVIDAQLAARR